MLTCIIPYRGEDIELTALLVMLQPQLHSDDDIYIIDSSKDQSALDIVKLYGSTRCYIFVEVAKVPYSDAVSLGLQSSRDNKQKGSLVIPPSIIIPTSFISNLKSAIRMGFDFLVFNTTSNTSMDPNFKWYSPRVEVHTLRPPIDIPFGPYYPYYESCEFALEPKFGKVGRITSEHLVRLQYEKNT